MRLLIDTNIFLEIILEQEKAEAAKDLLAKTREHEFFISDYSLHSIGLLLFRRKQHEVFQKFLHDTTVNAGVAVASVLANEMGAVADVARKLQLDFDDSYQYVTADKHGLTIVSFDSDFDRTERGRMTPEKILSH
jgi:predicted nucleic acid-binding protein